jgi:hypothetical protein
MSAMVVDGGRAETSFCVNDDGGEAKAGQLLVQTSLCGSRKMRTRFTPCFCWRLRTMLPSVVTAR